MQIEVNHNQEAVFRDSAGNVVGYWVPAANGSRAETNGTVLSDKEQRQLVRDCESLRKRVDELQTRCTAQDEEIDVLSQILEAYLKGEISLNDKRGSLTRLIEEFEQTSK